jgi:hypothetical protein
VEAEIGPVGAALLGLEAALRMVGDDERHLMGSQEGCGLGHEPARMAELERLAA